jgi:Glyoxalase-like domain
MALHLHHVFACSSVGAPEAEDLLEAGLAEGSPNTHPGQGTANRRFFFESGFLELLWVHDEHEARSTLTAPTSLWDRWAARGAAANPFGLCFSSLDGVDSALPFPWVKYRPGYLPDDRYLLFADNLPLSEPEVFVLGWPQIQTPPKTEPRKHSLGLREMRSVSVGVVDPPSISNTLRAIRDAGLVKIHHSVAPELVVEFISQKEVQLSVSALGLSLIGRQTASLPDKSLERARHESPVNIEKYRNDLEHP